MKFVLGLLMLGAASARVLNTNMVPKSRGGPASEFALHALPDPRDAAELERSSLFTVSLSADTASKRYLASTTLDVDSNTLFSVAVFGANAPALTLTAPNGQVLDVKPQTQNLMVGDQPIPSSVYVVEKPQVGLYQATLASSSSDWERVYAAGQADPKATTVSMALFNDSPVKLYSHLNNYNLLQGQAVGLTSAVTDMTRSEIDARRAQLVAQGLGHLPAVQSPDYISVSDAHMVVAMPNGSVVNVPMVDDGTGSDLVANDGVYSATIQATQTGFYQAEAVFAGTLADGTAFQRVTDHSFPVVASPVDFTGKAWAAYIPGKEQRVAIRVGVNPNSNLAADSSFIAYAEVYGYNTFGQQVPACYLESIVQVQYEANTLQPYVELDMDVAWLSYSGVIAGTALQLRNVRLQDSEVYVPVSSVLNIDNIDYVKAISTRAYKSNKAQIDATAGKGQITQEMLEGIMPTRLRLLREQRLAEVNGTATNTRRSTSPTLMTVHGYCASGNPFENDDHVFTGAAYYDNPNANVPNDVFAQAVEAYSESLTMETYGVIGHSQGGKVGTHLANYYFTGLDAAVGTRLVQSVGTPYQGCTAAGDLAKLGSSLGVGCGANFDLSRDGAALWNAGIAESTRKHVHYYTTTYKLGTFFGDSCSMVANMFLEWPNDGVTELQFATLSGAVNMGNTQKQCHTTDLNYMAQYDDETRNANMNKDAAR